MGNKKENIKNRKDPFWQAIGDFIQETTETVNEKTAAWQEARRLNRTQKRMAQEAEQASHLAHVREMEIKHGYPPPRPSKVYNPGHAGAVFVAGLFIVLPIYLTAIIIAVLMALAITDPHSWVQAIETIYELDRRALETSALTSSE